MMLQLLLLSLFVAGTVAQSDFNNDDGMPPFADDRIVILNDDADSLPTDIRGLLGSTQYGRPMPYGHHGLVKEGGAGIGEDYADGRIFGVDIDPNDLDLNNDDERPLVVGGGPPGSSNILSLLGIDSRPFDRSNAPSVRSHVDIDVDDDDDSFDLSQFGIGTSDSDDSYRGESTSTDISGIDLSDYGIGLGSSSTGLGSSSDSFDISQYGYDVDDDKKDDGADDLGPIDLSQFGIYSDDSSDDKEKTLAISSEYSDDDSDSSFDLSQFGIDSGPSLKDDDDDTGFDISDYLASIGDETPDRSDDDTFDLSKLGIESDDIDIPGVDFMPYLSAFENKATEKSLVPKEVSNENIVGVKRENGKAPATFTFNDLSINRQDDDTKGEVAYNQNVGIQDRTIPGEAQLSDPIFPDIPYLQNLISGEVQKPQDHIIPSKPKLQESVILDVAKVDPLTPTTQSPFIPERKETIHKDVFNSNVEYAVHSDRKQELPMVRGFDIIETGPYNLQELISNSTFGLSESLRQWLRN